MLDITSYVQNKFSEYKVYGSEIVVICPSCRKPKLSINTQSGAYQCFHCSATDPTSDYAKGHISKLQELFGDVIQIKPIADRIEPSRNQKEVDYTELVEKYKAALASNKSALRYLFNRGISPETAAHYSLGFCHQYDQDWLVIPSYENGIPKLLKYRKLPPDTNPSLAKYIREKGSKSILFNGDVIPKYDELVLCEGEVDTITLLQAGYENVVGMTGGAGTLLPEWYDRLYTKTRLYLVLDADPPGQNAAKDVWATRLGISKCWNVQIPVEDNDINQYFQTHTKEDFDKLLASAKRFSIEGVSSLVDVLYDLYNQSKDESRLQIFPTPWGNVDKLIGGGFRRGDLVIVGGSPGTGKTTFCMQLCYHYTKNFNMPSLLFCVEMAPTDLAVKVVQLNEDLSYAEVNPGDAMMYAMNLEALPLYLGFSSYIKPEVVMNTIREARNRYGIQFAVFDNLQALIRDNETENIGIVSKMFRSLSLELSIPLVVVSQPRKINSERDPTQEDLRGSNAIPADAEIVVLLHRKRMDKEGGESSLEPRTKIIVDKARKAPGGRTVLNYLGAKARFEEFREGKSG